ncbi:MULTISPECIES: methylated-DNA--[protein]-cysteine S-methyltransferase [Bacillaceae]|uniref:methylated-DNA--[protein]-cysteine S-methyltransferase n=1 Tax=Bacillaceae TaxID=186817 RepID=UPI001E5753BE|nr:MULTISPECIES: methylated-DNA--[protein]-cysteine S-methyltransferase [Bacillaceae]MCE4050849.1 methylated-DNA--[protein]-cysteine S-methyltransferase [Bacillus sp. Au-Bac7]MCM3029303.1 methylated-DNA--[protein]-cysteine S-methyltransferase [Niallia sp. MER 6]MDL0436481.1 methylated-DNA--[protein]-cysteine S-methyltransferase [Niallia sp. SS-2023]UPO88627.1 methylated-DNA--[protein]-cysteine S-methyltransferase [Niallia sp. Man26]
MNERFIIDYQSPIGLIEITGTKAGVYSVLFTERDSLQYPLTEDIPKPLTDCYEQLDQYFNGELETFSFPYIIEGTNFQKNVWTALMDISYGNTGSYKEIAVSIGNEKAIRAVGSANGRNKLCIVIPCHRIIGSNGSLTGYAGGLWRKEWLLDHENKKHVPKQ